jgi:hypothetical protein
VAPLTWSAADELFQGPPVPGAAAAAGRPVPDDAVAPAPGAVPESVRAGRLAPTDEVGRVLAVAENRGLIWLGPRTTPDGRSIDHVALSPNGVWLVQVEPPPSGRVERRDVGDWFTSEPRLSVGDVDRTAVVGSCRDVEASVARALVASPLEAVPRYQVLCFDHVAPGWLERPFEFQGVWVTESRHLVEPMLATVHLQRDELSRLAGLLDRILDRR